MIEAVGSTPTYQMAVDEVAFTGRVVCIGYAKAEVSFQTKYFVQNNNIIRYKSLWVDERVGVAYGEKSFKSYKSLKLMACLGDFLTDL